MIENNSLNTKAKSFWERKEGTTGMIAIGLAGLGVFLSLDFLTAVLGKLILVLGQTITIISLGGVLFAMYLILSNKRVRTLGSYMFKSVMRAITGWFVEIDPIGIMRNYIAESKKKREVMNESIAKLRGQIKLCEKSIIDNEQVYNNSMAEYKVATQKGLTTAQTLAARQAERMQKVNEQNLKPIHAQMSAHLRALSKYYEATDVIIKDMEQEVETQHNLREMMKASYGAMSMAKKIMQGGEERELYDMAMENSVMDFGMKLGEIENFMENSKGFIESLDIANGVADAKAMDRLREWEAQAESLVLGNEKRHLIEQQPTQGFVIPAPKSVDYVDLLNTKTHNSSREV